MKVLIADNFPELYISKLNNLGLDVAYEPDLKKGDLKEAVSDATILIVRSTKVTGECIKSSPDLSLIIRAGAGVNNIDVKVASEQGIYVSNCPGKNTFAVAELTMGLILALDRRIPDNVQDFHNGKWNKDLYSKADGVYDKKLGIIGVGRIGEEVIRRAHSFGMHVTAWSRSLTDDRASELNIARADSIQKLARHCDIISV
ncbi:MAG: NAD(P)-dependent oxidoreductase, partial [Balneolales bacterium]